MLKRTVFLSRPCYLSTKDKRLVIHSKDEAEDDISIPIEDIGYLIIEDLTITITSRLISSLVEANVAVVFCGLNHMPNAMLLNFDGHSTHTETLRMQIESSLPLKKQLWQTTVKAKIYNQSLVLRLIGEDNVMHLESLANGVKSGDPDNREGVAAKVYWGTLFGDLFRRTRNGVYPNPLNDYGYAIIRAVVARALVGSGLYPALGIHHCNRYNSFCLADDIMEPYRPFVDKAVLEFCEANPNEEQLSKEAKKAMLHVLTADTQFNDFKSPLITAVTKTTASLVQSFKEKKVKLVYPTLQ